MNSLTLRILLLAALLATQQAAVAASPSNQPDHERNHNEATVAQLEAEMAQGKLTSEQLTREYIFRILALDQSGPGVNAVIELNPDAIAMAKNADQLRRHGIV